MTVVAPKVLSDDPAPGVRRITLNRPEALNAIDDDVRSLLHAELERALGDADVRAVMLGASGSAFSAGGDIRYLRQLDRDAFSYFHGRLLELCRLIGTADKPIVASVRGACAGGALGIVLACDHVVASRTASLLIPFIRIGLTPDMALPYWLARRVGPQKARNLVLRDQPISAEDAFGLSICDELVDDLSLDEAGLAVAVRLAGLAPQALRQTRRLLRNTSMPLDEYLELERDAAGACLGGSEFVEGVAAFLGKRAPVWPHANSGD